MRKRGVKIGATLRCDMKQPRNPQFHRLAHALGQLVTQNIDDFSGKNAHDALKKLQIGSGVECVIPMYWGLAYWSASSPAPLLLTEWIRGASFS